MKKLLLNKETIASLGQDDFSNVRGGILGGLSAAVGVQCFGPSEDCTQNGENTCAQTCDTNNPHWLLKSDEPSCWNSCVC